MEHYKQLFDSVIAEDFLETEEALSQIIQTEDSAELIKQILNFMEANPDIDYGMPGPLVHYMERYFLKGYEELLYESVSKSPTSHTLWMLNRIMNSPKLPDRDKYIELLKSVSKKENIPQNVREEARSYYEFQIS